MQLDNQDRLLIAIFLSVLAHLGSFVSLSELADRSKRPDSRQLLVVDFIEPTPQDSMSATERAQTVVRQADLPEDVLSLEAQKNQRRFLSERDQNVKEEVRAALSGMTRNRQGRNPVESEDQAEQDVKERKSKNKESATNGGAPENRANKLDKEQSPSKNSPAADQKVKQPLTEANSQELPDYGDIDIGLSNERNSSSNAKDYGDLGKELIFPNDPRKPGMSTVGELLPEDMKIGNFTALNTDRFIYYTFYARVEEAIRHRWVRYVKAAIYAGQVPQSADFFRTKLEIVLDAKGQFINGFIHESSGVTNLDQAPLYAFREAERIPNPPREMVQSDGTIRLHYFFQVDKNPPRPVQRQDRSRVGP